MEHYKGGSHSVWDLKYHIVWTTKYRYKVLGGDVGLRVRELLREIARSQEMVIHAGLVNRDHVHLLISIPPQISVSRAVQFLRGKEFAQVALGVPALEEALLGTTSVGSGVLGL